MRHLSSLQRVDLGGLIPLGVIASMFLMFFI
jgi:hypothetical protein